ncbi:Allatostatin [Eumeta japonica]|uniref:Allatostatin n=1 Tax=Eumeta variegata TaxID=151549 RepID=A0A4C1VLC0_EUMVA|nr:Allatostatin [Eumeta japonica]
MRPTGAWHSGAAAALCAAALLLAAVAAAAAAPVDIDDDLVENSLGGHRDVETEGAVSLDSVDVAALRKLLMQLEAEDRMGGMSRVARSWGGAADTRGWGPRGVDPRIAPQWRTDKRQRHDGELAAAPARPPPLILGTF